MKRALIGSAILLSASVLNARAEVIKDHPEVVAVFSSLSFDGRTPLPGKCTGTFITPRLLLTASHCVRHFNIEVMNGQVVRSTDMSGNPVADQTATTKDVYIVKPTWYGGKKIHPVAVHVSDKAIPTESGTLDLLSVQQDLAILEFAIEWPATRDVTSDPAFEGEPVMMVGFGHHGTDATIKQGGHNFVDSVGYDQIVIDGPADVCDNPAPYAKDWATCRGDSGGPLIDEHSGKVIGVTSTSRDPVAQNGSSLQGLRKKAFFTDLSSADAQAFIQSVKSSVKP